MKDQFPSAYLLVLSFTDKTSEQLSVSVLKNYFIHKFILS